MLGKKIRKCHLKANIISNRINTKNKGMNLTKMAWELYIENYLEKYKKTLKSGGICYVNELEALIWYQFSQSWSIDSV